MSAFDTKAREIQDRIKARPGLGGKKIGRAHV